jgi:Pin2-interacting protein X1
LNGKSDAEVQKHQSALRDAELRTYQAQKYGHMNFVSGGFLVGDRIEPSAEYDSSSPKEDPATNSGADDTGRRRKKHKNEVDPVKGERDKKKGRLERREQEMNARCQDEPGPLKETEDVTPEPRTKEKSRKRSKSSQRTKAIHDSDITTAEDDRSRRKQERRARKEERRKRKEETRQSSSKPEPVDTEQRQTETVSEAPSAPRNAGLFAGNRNAVRRRYIEQKRMASLDPKAMNEIFMLKAAAG